MKKILVLSVLVIALLLTAAAPKLAGVQLINKGSVEAYVQFTNISGVYYLTAPEGSRTFPTEANYSIPPGWYTVSVFYKDAACVAPTFTYFVDGAINRFTILPCDELPVFPGEYRYEKIFSYIVK